MPSAQAEGRGVLKFKFSLGYTVSSGQSKPQSETVPNKNNCAVPQACNPSTKEADAGGWQATSRPRLHSEVPDRETLLQKLHFFLLHLLCLPFLFCFSSLHAQPTTQLAQRRH